MVMSTLVKKSPFFPAFFDDFFSKDFFDWNDKTFAGLGNTLPSVNLKETDNDYQVEMAVPGMAKEDFHIEMLNGVLSIRAEKKKEKEEKDEKGNYLRREFRYESFRRSFTLPDNIAEENVNASYKDGILHLSILKKTPKKADNPKPIEVK
jgi:HSP20 family protein